jgi:hypothetical protein
MCKLLVFIISFYIIASTSTLAVERKSAEFIVYSNDSTFRHHIIYNSQLEKVLQTKFLKNANQWDPLSQIEWLSDENQSTTQVFRKRVGNIWKNITELQSFFDNQRKTHEILSEFDNDTKIMRSKTAWDYNTNGSIATRIENIFVQNIEKPNKKLEYVYDSEGILTDTYELFYGDSVLRYRTQYIYKDNKLEKTILSKEHVQNSNIFEDETITQYFYVAGSNKLWSQRTRIFSKIWGWENKQMLQYNYNNDKVTEEIYFDWKSNAWAEQMRYLISFDINNNTEKRQLQLPIHKQWRNAVNQTYTYDSNTQLTINSTFDFWGGERNAPAETFITFDFNGIVETVMANKLEMKFGLINEETTTQNENLNTNIRIYPNPSDAIFYIDSKNNSIEEWSIKNLSGMTLKSSGSQYSHMIDLSEFRSGIYFLEVKINNTTIVRKLVKQ